LKSESYVLQSSQTPEVPGIVSQSFELSTATSPFGSFTQASRSPSGAHKGQMSATDSPLVVAVAHVGREVKEEEGVVEVEVTRATTLYSR
jgi:hypothetical protein